MNNILLSNNFYFTNLKFTTYHYTDNTKGSPMHYLAYMTAGRARIVSDHNAIDIQAGDLFYIPKNLCYQSYWYGEDDIDFLSFGFTYLPTKGDIGYELQKLPSSPKMVDRVRSLPTGEEPTCETLGNFYQIMAEFLPQMQVTPADKEELLLRKAQDYIRGHLSCTMADVAKACSISESYLYVLFQKTLHVTPNDFRQKVLCQKGIELLVTTDKSTEEISDLLNFSSSSYFRKVFKKHTGKTPKEVRKKPIF